MTRRPRFKLSRQSPRSPPRWFLLHYATRPIRTRPCAASYRGRRPPAPLHLPRSPINPKRPKRPPQHTCSPSGAIMSAAHPMSRHHPSHVGSRLISPSPPLPWHHHTGHSQRPATHALQVDESNEQLRHQRIRRSGPPEREGARGGRSPRVGHATMASPQWPPSTGGSLDVGSGGRSGCQRREGMRKWE